MKRLLIVAGVAAALAVSSCTKEDVSNEAPGAGGFPVSLTLDGSAGMNAGTKAEEGTVSGTLAALDKEKKVSSLLAAAFHKDGEQAGKLYKVFDVDVSGTPGFDMESAGVFDVWFVANADATLAGLVKGLAAGASTEDDLNKLIGTQVSDADNQFLMVSVDSKEIRTSDGATTKVTVTMRRASARFDIINAISGITVTRVQFVSRATNTLIATPNATADFAATFEDKDYTVTLPGYETPESGADAEKTAAAKCEAQIYSYENVNDDASHKPVLKLTYKVDVTGVEKTHTVAFTDEEGRDLQIRRNHLYRIVLNEKHSDMTVACRLTVLDWNQAEEFVFEELPFDKDLNATLLVNRFAARNVSEAGLDMDKLSFAFSEDNAAAHSAYAPFSEAWNGKKFTDRDDVHGTQYRIPTADEWTLLLPKKTDAETECPYVCFAADKMTAGQFTESVTVNGTTVSGNSWLTYDADAQAVYALRFMGSDQAAAYRYAFAEGALTVKIIALGKESTEDIDSAKNHDWNDAETCVEVVLQACGKQESGDSGIPVLSGEGENGFYWSATTGGDSGNSVSWSVQFSAELATVCPASDNAACYCLRPFSDYDTPVLK